MASDNEACCESDPNFAVICGFLEKFGVTCGLANIDFLDLQDMLENSQEVPQELVDLHVKLLRKARKSVSSERWERAIIKLCHGFCIQDAWEIERFGYKKARLSSKLRILKELLEMQFDYNAKFKNEINKLSAEELRTQPLGKDRVGHVYWFQSDNSCQIRVYKEDPDEETWSLAAKDREGLVNLITQLNDGQVTLLNEDSNSLESEKPVVDTGQTDSNSNSDSSKQDQMNSDTNTEENLVEINKKEESDSEKPQLDEEDNTQNNIEVAKLSKMRLKNSKISISDDSSNSKVGESLGNGNGEGVAEQEPKNEANPEKEDKDKCSSTTLSPPKTGISIRIKPISELISSSGVDVNKKLEITGVKEKYIRSDSSSSSSVHHRKAVDSAGFDVHTNYLKRPIEEEEDVQEPSYIKRPRLDRPTLLGNKKKKPYSDEEDEEEEEEEVSDEVEEPLMLVTGEGSGQDNEGRNSRLAETGSPIPEDDSPIVGEEIVESVVYFYGEGNGHQCETGNDNSPDKQDVASQQQNKTQNTTSNVDSTSDSSNPNVQRTSHESNKADTIDSIKDSEPSSNNDEIDCSVKTPTKSEFKLGTIIDVRTNKLISSARGRAKKSRWDIGKPDNESQISTEEISEDQCNSNSDTKLESEMEQKLKESLTLDMPKTSKGKVQELVNQWEKFTTPQKVETTTTPDETTDDSMSFTPKKSMFFFGPGCLQVKPTISPMKSDIFSESLEEMNIEQEQMSVEEHEKIQEVPNFNSETQDDGNPSISSNIKFKRGSYEGTLKTETLLESNVDSQLSSKKEELKNSDLQDTFKKPQVQKSLVRNVNSQSKVEIKQNVQKSDISALLKNKSDETLQNMEKPQRSSPKVSEVVELSLKRSESILDNNLLSVKGDSESAEQESIKSDASKISIQSKVAETKKISVSTVTEVGKNNEETVKGDSKKCDNLKLSCVEEKSSIKQPETSTSTILKLGNTKEEEKIDTICNLPNNIVPGIQHVPKNSVSKKELVKIDSSNSVSDDQKDNKLSDVPVSEKSHVSNVTSNVESGYSVSPKVTGLPVAEEQVENLNTSVLDNKPKSKLEDVQEDIKEVNIQKTDSVDLSFKNKVSDFKLDSKVSTREQPCSIEMQMAMIMGENLSDTLDFHEEEENTVSNAKIPISSNKSSAPLLESKCLPDTENPPTLIKQIVSETADNVAVSSANKLASDNKTPTISSTQKFNIESTFDDAKTQTVSKGTKTYSNVKKIVLKRSFDQNVSLTNTPYSSTEASSLISKSAVDLTTTSRKKEETPTPEVLSSLKKEYYMNADTIVPSVDKVPVAESNIKKLDEKQSNDSIEGKTSRNRPVGVTNIPILPGKSSATGTNAVLPIVLKNEDTPPSGTKKLNEKNKDVSSIGSELKLPEIARKIPEDVTAGKKSDDTQLSDTISSIGKPIIDAKSSNLAGNSSGSSVDASPTIKEINATKESSTLKPIMKKLSDKVEDISLTSKPVLVDAKPSVSPNKSDHGVGIVSSTVKVSEIQPIKKSASVKQDVKETSDKIPVNVADLKSPQVAVTNKPSNDNFRIPAEYQAKKSSSTGVSSLAEKPVLDINEVIVNATSGIPSNVNKSRVISLTEILSTSEKVPLSAKKGGISKPSSNKLPGPVVKEASAVVSDVKKQNIIKSKSKATVDAVVNKLSAYVKVPNVDKADTSTVNKSSINDAISEGTTLTNKIVVKDELSRDSTTNLTALSTVKKPAAPTIGVGSTDSINDKSSKAPILSKEKPLAEIKQFVKPVISKDEKPLVEAKSSTEPSLKVKSSVEIKGKVELIPSKNTPSVETKNAATELSTSAVALEIVKKSDTSKGKLSEVSTPVAALEMIKKSYSSKDKSSIGTKGSIGPILSKDKPIAETKHSVEPAPSKDTVEPQKLVEPQRSREPVSSKNIQSTQAKASAAELSIAAVEVNRKSETSTDKQPIKIKDSHESSCSKVKPLVELALITDKLSDDRKDSAKPIASKNKTAVEEQNLTKPVASKNKTAVEEPSLGKPKSKLAVEGPSLGKPTIKTAVDESKSAKPVASKNTTVVDEPSSAKSKIITAVEEPSSTKPVALKIKTAMEEPSSSMLVASKNKTAVEEPSLAKPKNKTAVEESSSPKPVASKNKTTVEEPSSAKSKNKTAVEEQSSAKPKNKTAVEELSLPKFVVSKNKTAVEEASSAKPIASKNKTAMEEPSSAKPVASKNKTAVEESSLANPKNKTAVEESSSAKPVALKNKTAVEEPSSAKLVALKNKTTVEEPSSVGAITPKNKPSKIKMLVDSPLTKDKPSVDTKEPIEAKVLQPKETECSVEVTSSDDTVSVKTKGSITELHSADGSIENKAVAKELVKSASATSTEDDTANRRVTRRTRSSGVDKSDPGIDNKNKKSINNKVSTAAKKAEVSTKKTKKPANEKPELSPDESETEENEKSQKSDDADVETPKAKGKQKKKVSKENDNQEKSSENTKAIEPQVTGDTNRELRQRKCTETNKNKGLPAVNENEDKKPRGRGRPKSKVNTVGTPKEDDKTVSSYTRSQAKEGGTASKEIIKKNETIDDLGDIEEQIVKTEIRPTKKLRLSDSSVEVTVIDKGKKIVTTPASEKPKESEKVEQPSADKNEPPKTRRSLRSSQLTNTDTAGKSGKDQEKVTNEPKETQPDTDKKEKAENQGLKPVDEPLCVQKKVPLLTCIDINKLKAQPETTSQEIKSDINDKPGDSSDSDDSGGFAGDVGVDADSDSSDDAVVIIPENDPLACSDESAPEPVQRPMTLATFKLDTDDASPSTPVTRVTRKRAAQQSIDALRDVRVQGKKTQLEKKEEGDSKRLKLKKRSVDRNLRRSIEEKKLKAVSSSEEEEEEEDNDDKNKSEPSVKQDSGKKSKGIAKRRISTRSTRATESPAPSSDALSEASRTDASNTPPVIKQKKPRKTKKTLLGLEISEETESIIKGDTTATVRQSRRIAQLKIKEEAERRKLEEEVTFIDLKDEQRKRKGKKSEDKDYKIEKRKRNKNLPTEDETTCDAESDEKKKRKRKRKHWDPTKKFDLFKAWKSSSGSSSSEIEDEEEEIEEDEDHHLVVKSDHEFSPESDLEEGGEVQPLKRARTARKESDPEEEVDDCACQKCGQKDHPEWILLCDSCDCGWHCSCLRPALLVIPEGDWFCPPCQHITLVKNLEEHLHEYDRKINKREMETRRKERLAYVGISLDNVLPTKDTDEHRQKHRQQHEKESGRVHQPDSGESGSDESGSDSESSSSSDSDSDEPVYQLRERRQAHSYRFNDYDELINSAIQDEIEAVKGAGNQGRGKDIATIVNAEKEEAEAERLKNEAVVEGTDVVPSGTVTAAVLTDPPTPVAAFDAAVAPETTAVEPLPPVVPPNYDAKPADDSDGDLIRPVRKTIYKKKHRKLNSLDVSSGDDADSDEDFKGSSSSESEEDVDEDDYSGSESSEAETRRGKRRKDFGPVRRSTRARISRYDRDFVNDSDSEEEEAPRRKKTRSLWDESESEESDRSWGKKKRKATNRSRRRKSSGKVKKSKKKKKKRRTGDDSDPEVYRKRPNIKFGGLNDDEEIGRRTRGKKINYLEALGTDSEEEIRRKPPRIEESEEEYNLHEDEDFKKQLENEKDSDESGVDTVLQDIAKNTQPRPKARGRGKSGLKIPRKPKDAPPPGFASLMPELSQPPMELPPPSLIDPTGLQALQPLQSLQALQPLQPLMAQPSMLEPTMMQEPDLQDPEDEPNPIEQINKNVEQMNEQEMEKMMEEEDYANKQLQLVALQIEKEKKRKEREAKRLEKIIEKEQKIPKKRGRKPKNQMLSASADLVPPYSESASMLMNSVMANNAELSEPPGVSLPMFSEIAPALNVDGTPRKRRGRGKGKKTLAAEAAAIAAANKDNPELDMGLEGQASSGSNTVSPAPDSPMHGTKLGIAAPPQPFSQSQPTPSVITRMLQSQPGQGSFPGGGAKYFGGLTGDPQLGPPPGSGPYHPGTSGPRGPMPGPYQQPPPGMPHYPVVRSGPAPPHRLHSPGPPGLPPMYHTHRSMDPSPSGGGPINVSTTSRDRHSPAVVSPSSSSPLSKGDPTPPPPPYTRPQVGHFAPGVVGSGAAGPRHVSMVPPHLQQHRGSNMSPYHPGVPPNYHFGSYPPPPPLNPDEGQSPPVYPSPAYSEPYPGEGGAPVQPSESSSGKPFDEDTGGEFVGLVSYFSSQREDDLDT